MWNPRFVGGFWLLHSSSFHLVQLSVVVWFRLLFAKVFNKSGQKKIGIKFSKITLCLSLCIRTIFNRLILFVDPKLFPFEKVCEELKKENEFFKFLKSRRWKSWIDNNFYLFFQYNHYTKLKRWLGKLGPMILNVYFWRACLTSIHWMEMIQVLAIKVWV